MGMLLLRSHSYGQVIDVHTHIVIPEYTDLLERYGAALEETFPLPHWDVDSHIYTVYECGWNPYISVDNARSAAVLR